MKKLTPFFYLLLFLLNSSIVVAQEIPKEISVSGEAAATLEPDSAAITLQYEAEGQTAAQAYTQSLMARETLLKSLNQAKFTSTLKTRGKKIHGPKNGPVIPGGIVYAKDIFSIEVQSLSNIEKVVDLALVANFSILNIEFKVSKENLLKNELLLTATTNAQRKARLVAQKLDVDLGELLSAGVSEEPQGAMMLQARHLGATHLGFDDKPMRVFVSLRYAIKEKVR